MNKWFKIQILLVFVLLIIMFTLSFNNPTITGNIPANVYTQKLDLVINESSNFLLTSDNLEPFIITSFKISGNVIGNGQAEIYIDTGRGQNILVYKNIVKREDDQLELFELTGQAVENIEGENVNRHDKWLVIKPIKILLKKEDFDLIGNDEYLVNGNFMWQCRDTCLMNMEMYRKVAYRLVFLVEEGTTLKIDEILFQTED